MNDQGDDNDSNGGHDNERRKQSIHNMFGSIPVLRNIWNPTQTIQYIQCIHFDVSCSADVCMDLRKDDTHKSVMQFNSISETYLLLCTSVAVAQICCHADVTQFMCNMHKSRSVFRRFWRSENKHGSGAVIQITLEVLVSSKRWWFWTGPNPDHCHGTELCPSAQLQP